MPRFTRLAGTAILAGSVRAFQPQLKNYDSISRSDASSSSNVAVYWGQNSYGQANGSLAQQPLATYCADSNIDIIPMAFLYQLTTGTGGQPVINFANQQNNCTLFDGTETLNCPDIGKDITTCQEKYNKTILLSVGGATYTEGGFSSADVAEANAEHIWATFGPKSSSSKHKRDNSTVLRPFGDASIDGFDIDLESTNQNFDVWTKKMRSLMDADSSKKYWLTAAPQCVYPDAADKSMLNGGIPFDAVWVQFYNNGCGLQSFVAGAKNQTNFNFDVWDNWASTVSANKNVKVYIGVPAGQTGAGSGYTAPTALQPIIDYAQGFKSFGGIMMWDASQAYANKGFLSAVKSAVGGGGGGSSSSSAVSAASTEAATSMAMTGSTSMMATSMVSASTDVSAASSSTMMTSASSSMVSASNEQSAASSTTMSSMVSSMMSSTAAMATSSAAAMMRSLGRFARDQPEGWKKYLPSARY